MAHMNCSDGSLIRLRHAVLMKHGKIYGVLKEEIDIALIERAEKLLKKEQKWR
jgi:hypothetical protein